MTGPAHKQTKINQKLKLYTEVAGVNVDSSIAV
jgi:hypothetical protein